MRLQQAADNNFYMAPVAQFQSAPVALMQGRNVALTGSRVIVGTARTNDREGGNTDAGNSR